MSKLKSCYEDTDCVKGSAEISCLGKYRHYLQRDFKKGQGVCIFVMLNPSDATPEMDDPTVSKCSKYCKKWGYSSLVIINLFDYRTKDPKELRKTSDPFGPKRSKVIDNLSMGINPMRERVKIVCAWGRDGKLWNRQNEIISQLREHFDYVDLECFKINKDGTPAHPLYQLDNAELIKYEEV